MRCDLTDLRLFLNVHEAGTITGGAERSHMTLASASERIRGMEAALGAALLAREPRGVQPTAAGRTLLHHARLVLQQMDQLQGELADYGAGLKGQVRLLCNTSALSEHLPQLLGGFLALHPGISVDLEERTSADIVAALRNAVCDVGLVSDAVDLQGLQAFAFRADPLVLIVPREHGLAARRSLALVEALDLAGGAWVGLTQDSAFQQHIAAHLRQLGRRISYRIRLRSFESVCRMVGEGIGVAIVPHAVAMRQARGAKIKRIALTDAWAVRHLRLCVRNLDGLAVPAQQLVRHLLASAA